MRVGELSRSSGVPVPTIKYYLREGLLPAGELTSPNQAHYGEEHLRRLRLVRALLDVGGLSLASVKEVLGLIDAQDESLHQKLGLVQEAITTPSGAPLDPAAVDQANAYLDRLGLPREDHGVEQSRVTRRLAEALSAARQVGHDRFAELLDAYADGLRIMAEADVAYIAKHSKVDDVVEGMVVATLIGDAVLTAARRLAQVPVSERLIGTGD
ncbi:MerR family transcriptional regulator [Lentzea aerocolonigenes]|uniref:MerR family transcriptional regulator n=1 Tax=Lentzea aerocolonigenes TaxID=68170 RepID=UPI0004C33726|nr:MerR family transcriptional regulator [Lentzea aerocolonigenes]